VKVTKTATKAVKPAAKPTAKSKPAAKAPVKVAKTVTPQQNRQNQKSAPAQAPAGSETEVIAEPDAAIDVIHEAPAQETDATALAPAPQSSAMPASMKGTSMHS
jgi:hypothetical protein